jgi:hypothetical protein
MSEGEAALSYIIFSSQTNALAHLYKKTLLLKYKDAQTSCVFKKKRTCFTTKPTLLLARLSSVRTPPFLKVGFYSLATN